MTTKSTETYERLKVEGRVSVERHHPSNGRVIGLPVLIVGPTGAGKSTFIEALANNSALQISSNQLDGFTQTMSAYRVRSAMLPSFIPHSHPIYLVDVPGFADTNISQLEIVSMLKSWMKENHVYAFSRMLYFTPINIVRFPGSQREVVSAFQALTGIKTAGKIAVVSTMWDTLWSESAKERAERNFSQLHDIWKEYFDQPEGCRIVKFTNTQESALSVLNAVFAYRDTNDNYNSYTQLETFAHGSLAFQDTQFGSHIHNDLQNRIRNLQIQRDNIRLEMEDASRPSDEELTVLLGSQLEQVEKYLAKFEQQLDYFLSGVISPGMEDLSAYVAPPTRGTLARMSDSVQSWSKSIRKRFDR